MRKLKEEMERWMEVREETARQKVSAAEEELKRVLGENAKVKKALRVAPEVAVVPLPRDETFILDEISQDHQRRERNEPRSPRHKSVHYNEVFSLLDEPHGLQPYDIQGTKRIASLEKELEELRLRSVVLLDKNSRLEFAHLVDQETIEGLRLEMQEAITELDALRTRHIADKVHSESAGAQGSQNVEAYIPPTPSITPQDHINPPTAKPPAQPPSDICPPNVAEKPKGKRKKKKAAVMATPVEPVLFVDSTNPQQQSIQSYQQKMYLLQVKVYSRSPVDVWDIPWPVFPCREIIHSRKEIKSAEVMEFSKAFWIGGDAKERATEVIAAWSWMCPPGRVECTKDLRSWIGRTTTFLRQAREKLGL